eukprot:Skav205004  [mRNA]  locus=scaffold3521:145882:146370:- [translate_table: standard]
MVLVLSSGEHQTVPAVHGPNGFLQYTWNGQTSETEVPNLELKTSKNPPVKKRPAAADSAAQSSAPLKRPASAKISKAVEEFPSEKYKIEHYRATKSRKYPALGVRRKFGDCKQIWSQSLRLVDDFEAARAKVESIRKELNENQISEKDAVDRLYAEVLELPV